MPNITLQSGDGTEFIVPLEVVRKSITISNEVEEVDDDNEGPIFRVEKVDGVILKKVVAWLKHHKDDPSPAVNEDEDEEPVMDMSTWDKRFLKVDNYTLIELILAATYLDIKGLVDLTCKSVALMIEANGKTASDIRKMFNIKNDFTLAEELQIMEENELIREENEGK